MMVQNVFKGFSMELKKDIISIMNPKKVYGKKGEKVKFISRHGHVFIVENKAGDRFPVSDNNVNQNK